MYDAISAAFVPTTKVYSVNWNFIIKLRAILRELKRSASKLSLGTFTIQVGTVPQTNWRHFSYIVPSMGQCLPFGTAGSPWVKVESTKRNSRAYKKGIIPSERRNSRNVRQFQSNFPKATLNIRYLLKVENIRVIRWFRHVQALQILGTPRGVD